jgi:hypothetical protein
MRAIPVFLVSMVSFYNSLGQSGSMQHPPQDIFRYIELKSQNNIHIEQDRGIYNLVHKHIEKNIRNPGIDGFRIRIYADVGTHARSESEAVTTRFYEKIPDIPVYRVYDDRWWKVYVGDFRTRVDAIKSLRKIERLFPGINAFVVPEKINFPRLN